MQSFLERIKSLSISETLRANLLHDLFAILVNTVANLASSDFSPEEKAIINKLAEDKEYANIVEELQKHFSEEEWNSKVLERINGIVKNYEEEVLSVIA